MPNHWNPGHKWSQRPQLRNSQVDFWIQFNIFNGDSSSQLRLENTLAYISNILQHLATINFPLPNNSLFTRAPSPVHYWPDCPPPLRRAVWLLRWEPALTSCGLQRPDCCSLCSGIGGDWLLLVGGCWLVAGDWLVVLGCWWLVVVSHFLEISKP